MSNTVFYFNRHEAYELSFIGTDKTISIKGDDLLDTLDAKYRNQCAKSILIPELKNLHVALSRAVEEGDQLKIGIVLGQTISKLEQLINN